MQPDKRQLSIWLALLLSAGFIGTSLLSYVMYRDAIRQSITAYELPLTSKNIYLDLQKELLRPNLIASMMANDPLLHDLMAQEENSAGQIVRYLSKVKAHYGVTTSFFISEKSRVYYHADGILKRVKPDEPHDAWYFSIRELAAPYETSLDPDFANGGVITIFADYRVVDEQGQFLGVTGVGLTVDSLRQRLRDYETRYRRIVYFTDATGKITLSGSDAGLDGKTIRDLTGLETQLASRQSPHDNALRYERDGRTHFLNIWPIPELNWHLVVDASDDEALSATRQTLYVNLLIGLAVMTLVLLLTNMAIGRYQRQLEELAATDKLSGLPNRRTFDLLARQVMRGARRSKEPLSIMLLDIDHFKDINDRYGHLAGDRMIREVAQAVKAMLRHADILSRWGGEEFIALCKGCDRENARLLAEKFRATIAAHPFAHDGQPIAVTVSCGVAQGDSGETFEQWFERADRALYAAKRTGRNRVCVAE
ncbi:MAG: sensor domain-containing diguanylate cyclase [Azonexus sp.]|jgi:diguanylate cyclase (GGDEF)-like protein|nr:sensor domain-containing diguanylate cyclase [Azonexus sp.]